MPSGKPEAEKSEIEVQITKGQWKKIKELIGDTNTKLETLTNQIIAEGKETETSLSKKKIKKGWWGLANDLNKKHLQAKKDEVERVKNLTLEEREREADFYQLDLEKIRLKEELQERAWFAEKKGWIKDALEKIEIDGKKWWEIIKEITTGDLMEKTNYDWDDEKQAWIREKWGLTAEEKADIKHLETAQTILRKTLTKLVMDAIMASSVNDKGKRHQLLTHVNVYQSGADWAVYEEIKKDKPEFFVYE